MIFLGMLLLHYKSTCTCIPVLFFSYTFLNFPLYKIKESMKNIYLCRKLLVSFIMTIGMITIRYERVNTPILFWNILLLKTIQIFNNKFQNRFLYNKNVIFNEYTHMFCTFLHMFNIQIVYFQKVKYEILLLVWDSKH